MYELSPLSYLSMTEFFAPYFLRMFFFYFSYILLVCCCLEVPTMSKGVPLVFKISPLFSVLIKLLSANQCKFDVNRFELCEKRGAHFADFDTYYHLFTS